MEINAIVLAAGKGSRLKVATPKPLCTVLNKPLIDYTVELLKETSKKIDKKINTTFVLGHDKESILAHLESTTKNFAIAYQEEQLGTGHAVKICFDQIETLKDSEYTFVLCADTPLISSESLNILYSSISEKGVDAVCASFNAANPTGYGRIIKMKTGFQIIEEKDATNEQRTVREVNSGVYIFKTSYLVNHISDLKNNNSSNEFYLTDLFQENQKVIAKLFEDSQEFLGINDMAQLSEAENLINRKKIYDLQKNGVRFILPETVYLGGNIEIGTGSVIYPNVTLEEDVTIESNVKIEAGCTIKNSKIKSNSIIKASSYIEKSIIGENCKVGPMAHLRPETVLENDCRVGNFVEIKKSTFKQGSKASHLSYIGDAQIGEKSNLGCGFITCNYDGADKHKTIIGKNCFIGSDTQLIAPITLGDEVYIASGSTINKSLPTGAFGIARSRQQTKEGQAKKFIKTKEK